MPTKKTTKKKKKKATKRRVVKENTTEKALEHAIVRVYHMEELEHRLMEIRYDLSAYQDKLFPDDSEELEKGMTCLLDVIHRHRMQAYQDTFLLGLAGTHEQQKELRKLAATRFIEGRKGTKIAIMHLLEPKRVHKGHSAQDEEEFREDIRKKFHLGEEEKTDGS